MTKTQAVWAERVSAWRASGKSAEEFAPADGFKPSTLRFWASRLKHLEAGSEGAGGSGVRMVRLSAARSTSMDAALVVLVGDARIEVHAGFDEVVLRKVVSALGNPR